MKFIFGIFVLIFIFSFSCTKNKLGGSAKISGTVMHHSRFIPNARVFVKFNATDSPGLDSTKYDARIVCDAAGKYSFKCYKGDYFLFGYAFDNLQNEIVKGGLHIKVRTKENLETDVAVSE